MLVFYADLNLSELEGSSNNSSISTLYNMGFSFYQKDLDAIWSNAVFDTSISVEESKHDCR